MNPRQRADTFIVNEILRLGTRRQLRRRQDLRRSQVISRSRVQTQQFLPALRIYVWSSGRIDHWLRRISSNATIADIFDIFIAVGDYRRCHLNLWMFVSELRDADGSILSRLLQKTLINRPRTADIFLLHGKHLFTFIFAELYRLKTAVLGENLVDQPFVMIDMKVLLVQRAVYSDVINQIVTVRLIRIKVMNRPQNLSLIGYQYGAYSFADLPH